MRQRNETDSILVSNTNRRNERKFIRKHKQRGLHIKLSRQNFTKKLRKNRQNLKTFKMWSHFNSNNIKNENFQYENEK